MRLVRDWQGEEGARSRPSVMHTSLLLAFGLVSMLAVLISALAKRSVLSISVVFLVAGFVIGDGGLRLVHVRGHNLVQPFTELALFTILFADGLRLPLKELRSASRLPGRALLVGMPLTLLALAAAAHFILGTTWTESFLIGAILSPTDPTFVAAILNYDVVPVRLRKLLSVESGLNDGIALPAVMVFFDLALHREAHPLRELLSAGLGLLLGGAIPAVFLWLEGRRFFGADERYQSLAGLAVATTLYGLAKSLGANEFLAAFTGGITMASLRPELAQGSHGVGEQVAEVIKFATLLLFGAALSVSTLLATGAAGVVFAAAALLVARPLGTSVAFFRGDLSRMEWMAAAWFGPKGFASLLYAFLLLDPGLSRGRWLFDAVALVVVLSILAHSSTEVPMARVFRRSSRSQAPAPVAETGRPT